MNLAYTFTHQREKHDRAQFMVWDIEANDKMLASLVSHLKFDSTVIRFMVMRNDEIRPVFKKPVIHDRPLPKSYF